MYKITTPQGSTNSKSWLVILEHGKLELELVDGRTLFETSAPFGRTHLTKALMHNIPSVSKDNSLEGNDFQAQLTV